MTKKAASVNTMVIECTRDARVYTSTHNKVIIVYTTV